MSFMTWVSPRCVHLFFGHRLSPCAAVVAGVTAVENDRTRTQAQDFVDWLMALTYPCNATSPTPWVLFTTDMTAPVGDQRFMAWCQACLGQMLPSLAGATSGVGGTMSQIATPMGDLLNVECGQHSDAQAAHTAASQPKMLSKFFNTHLTEKLFFLCDVASIHNLPDIWIELATGNGKRECETIEMRA